MRILLWTGVALIFPVMWLAFAAIFAVAFAAPVWAFFWVVTRFVDQASISTFVKYGVALVLLLVWWDNGFPGPWTWVRRYLSGETHAVSDGRGGWRQVRYVRRHWWSRRTPPDRTEGAGRPKP